MALYYDEILRTLVRAFYSILLTPDIVVAFLIIFAVLLYLTFVAFSVWFLYSITAQLAVDAITKNTINKNTITDGAVHAGDLFKLQKYPFGLILCLLVLSMLCLVGASCSVYFTGEERLLSKTFMWSAGAIAAINAITIVVCLAIFWSASQTTGVLQKLQDDFNTKVSTAIDAIDDGILTIIRESVPLSGSGGTDNAQSTGTTIAKVIKFIKSYQTSISAEDAPAPAPATETNKTTPAQIKNIFFALDLYRTYAQLGIQSADFKTYLGDIFTKSTTSSGDDKCTPFQLLPSKLYEIKDHTSEYKRMLLNCGVTKYDSVDKNDVTADVSNLVKQMRPNDARDALVKMSIAMTTVSIGAPVLLALVYFYVVKYIWPVNPITSTDSTNPAAQEEVVV